MLHNTDTKHSTYSSKATDTLLEGHTTAVKRQATINKMEIQYSLLQQIRQES